MPEVVDDFSRWAAEHTSTLVAQREADRQYVESKATTSLAFVLAVAAFASQEKGLLEAVWSRRLVIVALAILGVTLPMAARVVFAKRVAAVDPSVYVKAAKESAAADAQDPFMRVARHHELVAIELGREINRRGKWAFWMQLAVLVSVICFLAAVAVSRWGGPHP